MDASMMMMVDAASIGRADKDIGPTSTVGSKKENICFFHRSPDERSSACPPIRPPDRYPMYNRTVKKRKNINCGSGSEAGLQWRNRPQTEKRYGGQ